MNNIEFVRERFLEVVIGVGAVMLLVSVLIGTDADVDWGDVPTWVAGLIASAALYAAWRAGSTAQRLLKVEEGREDRAERTDLERRATEERAAQADLVAAWIDRRAVGPKDALRWAWGLVVRNGSPLPIWDVTAETYAPDGELRGVDQMSLVPPDEVFRKWNTDLRNQHEDEDPPAFVVAISFRDAAGRTWKRSKEGVLSQTGVVAFGELGATLPLPQVEVHGSYTPPEPEQ